MEKLKKLLDRIFIDGLTGMAQGLFATLIVGTIIQQIGSLIGGNVGDMIFVLGKMAAAFTGAGIGVGVAYRFKESPLVVLSAATAGMVGVLRVEQAEEGFAHQLGPGFQELKELLLVVAAPDGLEARDDGGRDRAFGKFGDALLPGHGRHARGDVGELEFLADEGIDAAEPGFEFLCDDADFLGGHALGVPPHPVHHEEGGLEPLFEPLDLRGDDLKVGPFLDLQEAHVIGVPFDHVAVGGLGKGLGVGDAVGVHEAHHLGGYGAAFHERLAQAFEAAEVPELEFDEAPPVVLPGDAVHAHGQPRAGVGLVGAFRAGELHPSALLIHGPFLRPAFQVGVDVHALAVVALDGGLPERVGGFPYPCRDVFRERVEVDGFLGYDLHGRAHRVAFDHIAGQREQAQPLLGVVVVADVARHDEVLVAFRDHRAVLLYFRDWIRHFIIFRNLQVL